MPALCMLRRLACSLCAGRGSQAGLTQYISCPSLIGKVLEPKKWHQLSIRSCNHDQAQALAGSAGSHWHIGHRQNNLRPSRREEPQPGSDDCKDISHPMPTLSPGHHRLRSMKQANCAPSQVRGQVRRPQPQPGRGTRRGAERCRH